MSYAVCIYSAELFYNAVVAVNRSENLVFSLVLLFGCYSAILIPAYLPLGSVDSLSDHYQQPKDQVRMVIIAIICFFKNSYKASAPLFSFY